MIYLRVKFTGSNMSYPQVTQQMKQIGDKVDLSPWTYINEIQRLLVIID